MKYIENDMDELFNKAGNNYPLNTDKKNWDAVKAALDSQSSTVQPPAATRNLRKYYPLLLLLLVPILLVVYDNSGERTAITQSKNASSQAAVSSETQKRNSGSTAGEQQQPDKTGDGESSPANQPDNEPTIQAIDPTVEQNREGITSENSDLNVPENSDRKASDKNETGNTATVTGKTKRTNDRSTGIRQQNGTEQTKSGINNNDNQKLSIIREQNDGLSLNNIEQSPRYNSRTIFPALALLDNEPGSPFNTVTDPTAEKAPGQPADAPVKKEQATKKKHSSSIYYGIIAGPDISSIKNQEIKNVGSGVGVLIGYRFSKHWSAEISGLWSSKKYYSDGKYFDKSRAQIPWSVEIYYVNGGCSMIEVPIDVRYEFTPLKNSFFVTAGLNTYFMKKERYDYKAGANGMIYEGYRKYSNSGNHFFSNLQLSGGYQYKLFNKIKLRVEPYLQVPLKHIGIGKMPITSAGVHFGLMRETK